MDKFHGRMENSLPNFRKWYFIDILLRQGIIFKIKGGKKLG